MTRNIQLLPGLEFTVFALAGGIQREHLAELQTLLDLQTSCEEFVLDLKGLKLVDRESIRFLAHREAGGIELRNCRPYIREWISQEQSRQLDHKGVRTHRNSAERRITCGIFLTRPWK
jgi:hypothetical protein